MCCRSYAKFTPNSQYVLIGTLDDKTRLWDYRKERVLKNYEGGLNKKYSLSPMFVKKDNMSYLVSGSEDGFLCIWDVQSTKLVNKVKLHNGAMTGLDMNDTQIVTCSLEDKQIKFWNRQ